MLKKAVLALLIAFMFVGVAIADDLEKFEGEIIGVHHHMVGSPAATWATELLVRSESGIIRLRCGPGIAAECGSLDLFAGCTSASVVVADSDFPGGTKKIVTCNPFTATGECRIITADGSFELISLSACDD